MDDEFVDVSRSSFTSHFILRQFVNRQRRGGIFVFGEDFSLLIFHSTDLCDKNFKQIFPARFVFLNKRQSAYFLSRFNEKHSA
jgi:hypothetical protein